MRIFGFVLLLAGALVLIGPTAAPHAEEGTAERQVEEVVRSVIGGVRDAARWTARKAAELGDAVAGETEAARQKLRTLREEHAQTVEGLGEELEDKLRRAQEAFERAVGADGDTERHREDLQRSVEDAHRTYEVKVEEANRAYEERREGVLAAH